MMISTAKMHSTIIVNMLRKMPLSPNAALLEEEEEG